MKYRDNMTKEEMDRLMADVAALDAAYAAAAAHDAAVAHDAPDDEWEDEMETLRRAALNRGQP
jgi:hypothetical protein